MSRSPIKKSSLIQLLGKEQKQKFWRYGQDNKFLHYTWVHLPWANQHLLMKAYFWSCKWWQIHHLLLCPVLKNRAGNLHLKKTHLTSFKYTAFYFFSTTGMHSLLLAFGPLKYTMFHTHTHTHMHTHTQSTLPSDTWNVHAKNEKYVFHQVEVCHS